MEHNIALLPSKVRKLVDQMGDRDGDGIISAQEFHAIPFRKGEHLGDRFQSKAMHIGAVLLAYHRAAQALEGKPDAEAEKLALGQLAHDRIQEQAAFLLNLAHSITPDKAPVDLVEFLPALQHIKEIKVTEAKDMSAFMHAFFKGQENSPKAQAIEFDPLTVLQTPFVPHTPKDDSAKTPS